jgi:predicted nucleotidyltransferase
MRVAQNKMQRFTPVISPPVVSGADLTQELRKAVRSLRAWPGVRRIWLFGSAAGGMGLDWRSDLDFAVEGLAPEHLERAWAALDEAVRFPVDLVRMETTKPALREAIARDGRVVYET